jgi:hypothetical protein
MRYSGPGPPFSGQEGSGRPLTLPSYGEGIADKSKEQESNLYSSKSGTLEMLGLLLPILSNSKELASRHIVLDVGIMEAGWRKGF